MSCALSSRKLEIRELFSAPTLKDLAETVEAALLEQSSEMQLDHLLGLLEGLDEEEAQLLLTSDEELS